MKLRNTMRLCSAAALLVALLASALVVQAQAPDGVQVVQTDESRFPEVDVYVSVTDADGQPVKNLMPEDFSLEENGQPVKLTRVSRAGEQGPVTVVLVIDKSGSMEVEGKMTAAQEAAIAFVEMMRAGDSTGVISFNTEVEIVQSLTDDRDVLVQAIEGIVPVGDTALYDALHEAVAMLEGVSGRKAIIAVTDGMSNSDRHTLQETLTLVGEQGISIYTVGLGDPSQGTGTYAGIDEPTLQAIAEQSSGIYAYAPNPEDLRSLYELLSLRIQNEYKLTYRSPNQLRDGVNRDVAVGVNLPSGSAEADALYNPGGVMPEVEPSGATWGIFGVLSIVLICLLVAPGVVSWVGSLREDGGAATKGSAKGKRKPTKGRIRLTD